MYWSLLRSVLFRPKTWKYTMNCRGQALRAGILVVKSAVVCPIIPRRLLVIVSTLLLHVSSLFGHLMQLICTISILPPRTNSALLYDITLCEPLRWIFWEHNLLLSWYFTLICILFGSFNLYGSLFRILHSAFLRRSFTFLELRNVLWVWKRA